MNTGEVMGCLGVSCVVALIVMGLPAAGEVGGVIFTLIIMAVAARFVGLWR